MARRKSKSPIFDRATSKAARVDRLRKTRKVKPDKIPLGDLLEDYRQDPSEAIAKYRKEQAKGNK